MNTSSDTLNCGACGHDCKGGGCVNSQCQPVGVQSLNTGAVILGLDSTNLYYTQGSSFSLNAFEIGKNVTGGSGTGIGPTIGLASFVGVVGNTLYWNSTSQYSCTISSCTATTYAYPTFAPFVSWHAASPQYIPQFSSSATAATVTWYSSGSVNPVATSNPGGFDSVTSLMASSNGVYWLWSGSLYGTNTTMSTGYTFMATNLTQNPTIADVNVRSILLLDNSAGTNLSRVPLPSGLDPHSSPQVLIGASGAATVVAATEDENYVYWMDVLGNVNRCAATNCSTSQAVIVSGQATSVPALFQDDAAIYWSGGQIMRLAK